MAHFRAYLDRTKGGEHSRVVDVELPDVGNDLTPSELSMAITEARKVAEAEAKRGETVSEVVMIYLDGPDANGQRQGTVPHGSGGRPRLLIPGDTDWRNA